MKPTMQLRWVEVYDPIKEKGVLGIIPEKNPGDDPTYFKLQQWFEISKDEDGGTGIWRDIGYNYIGQAIEPKPYVRRPTRRFKN